jgi:hypothetical protein
MVHGTSVAFTGTAGFRFRIGATDNWSILAVVADADRDGRVRLRLDTGPSARSPPRSTSKRRRATTCGTSPSTRRSTA